MVAKNDMEKMLEKLGNRYGPKVNNFDRPQLVSSGSISLDNALGGGYPQGRLIEMVGVPSVGKSSLTLAGLAQQQREFPDKAVCYIDMEATFDPEWAELWGVDLDPTRFTLFHPDHSEDVSDVLKTTLQTGFYSAACIDSVGAMETKSAMEKDAEEYSVGRNAQVITRMIKTASVEARKHKATIFLINQLRANIGAMRPGIGISAGPKILPYNNSVKLVMSKSGGAPKDTGYFVRMDGDDIQVGHQATIKVEKNKVGLQGKVAKLFLITYATEKYGPVGIDLVDDTVSGALLSGSVQQTGAWYTLPDGDRVNGRAKLEEKLRDNEELLYAVREASLANLRGHSEDDEVIKVEE